eukprot:CAMPEP_0113672490 /NCGR_PEP_ID=MMETSP0038_2-20120614/6299_1 /TAXON_ID=2898 /ORGANISM="Cryptomonas paramecium" /LENGTH=253 /DNA_ID=CAMNT_0000588779 /DNA_START=9 /DNA_END=767 /DNA_ORIENTATION=+ /assembly_acc=CAM_ASM_000170
MAVSERTPAFILTCFLAVSLITVQGQQNPHERESALFEIERKRPMLASEWIATDFGKQRRESSSFLSALHPSQSLAFHRGSFVDNKMQMLGQSHGPTAQPAPYTAVTPIEIQCLDGKYLIQADPTTSYLISIFYPRDDIRSLWFQYSLDEFLRDLPPTTHVVFAVSDSTPFPEDVIQSMHSRCSNSSNYLHVKDRLHFMSTPIPNECSLQTFPSCKDSNADWIGSAAAAWGSVEPTVQARWLEGTSEVKYTLA